MQTQAIDKAMKAAQALLGDTFAAELVAVKHSRMRVVWIDEVPIERSGYRSHEVVFQGRHATFVQRQRPLPPASAKLLSPWAQECSVTDLPWWMRIRAKRLLRRWRQEHGEHVRHQIRQVQTWVVCLKHPPSKSYFWIDAESGTLLHQDLSALDVAPLVAGIVILMEPVLYAVLATGTSDAFPLALAMVMVAVPSLLAMVLLLRAPVRALD